MKRFTFLFPLLIAALPARAADCTPPQLVASIRMMPTLGGDADMVAVTIAGGNSQDGAPHDFLLDTGGFFSQVSRTLVKQLDLPLRPSEQELYDAAGNVSREQTRLAQFAIGPLSERDAAIMVSPNLGVGDARGVGGILALDRLAKYDMELDFSTGTLTLFSPDHCPGPPWSDPATASMAIRLRRTPIPSDRRAPDMRGVNIFLPVRLDGHSVDALLDTGATTTALRQDIARGQYGLSLGGSDAPASGSLNGNDTLPIYSHLFKILSFGQVSIADPRINLIPNAMGRTADHTPLVGDRARTERDLVNEPEMILGMDVLSRLHLFIALSERKIYVAPGAAGAGDEGLAPYPKEFLTAMLTRLDAILAQSPNDARALNDRCFWRAIAKENLDGALGDCDKSLALEPGVPATLDSRAFVRFQQGRYPEALSGYNAALAAAPSQAPSLWMRGLTRIRLGDAGGGTDMKAAETGDPHVAAEYKRIGITAP